VQNVVELFRSKTAAVERAAAVAPGAVVLVGAGPGDPELLTRKALTAVSAADIIFYDELVSAEILAEIPSRITRVYVGKRHGVVGIRQADIVDAMVGAAKAGKRVVRLKGGDPMIFGRGGEEIEALRAHGIAVSVVPGITAATGAASTAGIPLTHRDHAAQLTILTGTRHDGALSDVRGLAGEGKTLAVYMAVRRAGELSRALLDDGVAASLPVAVVENATRPDERVFITSVGDLGGAVTREKIQSPSLIIVGRVAAAAAQTSRAGDVGGFQWRHFANG
jgi:uroporphyrin-III C-methyltransferase